MMKKISLLLSLTLLFTSFLAHSQTINPGPWRFELQAAFADIPFIIHFKENKKGLTGTLENGKESIKLTEIKVEKNNISIPLQMYEMTLELKIVEKGIMDGFLVRHNKDPKVKTPVVAKSGISERFPKKEEAPKIDLNGRWSITLDHDNGASETGVLLFEQKGSKLSGSILTPTGDYRYISGQVFGNKFEAASFDGIYNYLLTGEVNDGKLTAKVLAGYTTHIKGKKDQNAQLPDAYKQTQLPSMSFSFPDLKGNVVTLADPQFKNKPVIVQFFGSWCPNCIDEMNYMIPWYNKNKDRGIEIIALSFERSLNEAEAKRQLLKVQKKSKVPYTLLLAGSTSADKPDDKIKGLKNFISFPTTVYLNKKHEVVKVHAGFNGPSTGEFYEKWIVDFNNTVDDLLK